uniref:Ubiquitinyl hydrolase 1 n=1 Tax=Parascaris univalens TaxID=6257 RepID=A0A914ZI61_PARUN
MASEGGDDAAVKSTVRFAKISPSLENMSDFLSIVGANANLRLIGECAINETDDLYGYVGYGCVDAVIRRSRPVENCSLVKLNEIENGELASCLLNVAYPKAFSRESAELIDTSCNLRDNSALFLEAAFAQHFISIKEGTFPADIDDKLFHMFAFVPQDGRMLLLHDGLCCDATSYFEKHIWICDESKKNRSANFMHLLDSTSFRIRLRTPRVAFSDCYANLAK